MSGLQERFLVKAPSRLDLVNWYCAPLLAALVALIICEIIGPWAVIVLGFGLHMHWMALKALVAFVPVALVPLGALAYRQARGIPRPHVIAAFALGALAPLAYASRALWPDFR